MLSSLVHQKQLLFYAAAMDIWYATQELMLFTESLQCAATAAGVRHIQHLS